ncbi:hypothetical protein INR49_022085 [Caranx melampygus]|nr:hypothetical protein INR49_022085 [Caranx melampygus]
MAHNAGVLGVQKIISDPEAFLQALCRWSGCCAGCWSDSDPDGGQRAEERQRSQRNIGEFIRAAELRRGAFEVNDLLQGLNFSKVLNSLSFDSLTTHSRSSKLLQPQYRSLDMSEGSGCGQLLVRARFAFQQTNEDELSFSKGDIISVSRQEEGGWWEGSLNGKSGWFPNKTSEKSKSCRTSWKQRVNTHGSCRVSWAHTCAHFTPQTDSALWTSVTFKKPGGDLNLPADVGSVLRGAHKAPREPAEDRGLLPQSDGQMKIIYVAYCSSHPSAVSVLTQHSEELESKEGASTPGILTLTTSLSKPFTRLERYPTLLKELDRHMEDQHPDRVDLHAAMTAFKNLAAQCQEVRKKKDLELQILTEPIRNWEGDDIKTLGPVLHMSQATVPHRTESNERYLVLFPHTLLMLSASLRMSGFIYQLPSHPVTPARHSESRGGSIGHTYHTLPHPSSYGTAHSSSPMWGPLEPPSTPKPWSLSCLRPAPPLRPSAALCYKSKSPKNMKKLLPKRKPERKPSEEDFTARKSTAALEEDAQILKVIEAYCTSAKTRQTLNSSSSRKDVHMLFPEEEKIIVEETRSNGQPWWRRAVWWTLCTAQG